LLNLPLGIFEFNSLMQTLISFKMHYGSS